MSYLPIWPSFLGHNIYGFSKVVVVDEDSGSLHEVEEMGAAILQLMATVA